jgi:hypothetical protein
MRVNKILFETEQKMYELPFPIYINTYASITADRLITKITKYDWPKERQGELKTLCEMIRKWSGRIQEEETDESSR